MITRLFNWLDWIRWRLRKRTIRGASVDVAAGGHLAWVLIRRRRRRTLWVELPRDELNTMCAMWIDTVDCEHQRALPLLRPGVCWWCSDTDTERSDP